jgi:hypothetical protein
MNSNGFGTGYETNSFTEDVGATGMRRLAAIIFWRGGGSTGAARVGTMTATGERASLPIRLLLYAILPVVWVADKVIQHRRKRRRRASPFKPAPMSPAVRAAQGSARYEAGVVTIGSHVHAVPAHATLVVFVEDDPSRDDGLSITTHRIATDPYTPTPKMDPADLEFLKTTKDPKAKQEILMKWATRHHKGEGQAFLAIHRDPVCNDFTRRAGAESGPD